MNPMFPQPLLAGEGFQGAQPTQRIAQIAGQVEAIHGQESRG
jgi:hypothetical protein